MGIHCRFSILIKTKVSVDVLYWRLTFSLPWLSDLYSEPDRALEREDEDDDGDYAHEPWMDDDEDDSEKGDQNLAEDSVPPLITLHEVINGMLAQLQLPKLHANMVTF